MSGVKCTGPNVSRSNVWQPTGIIELRLTANSFSLDMHSVLVKCLFENLGAQNSSTECVVTIFYYPSSFFFGHRDEYSIIIATIIALNHRAIGAITTTIILKLYFRIVVMSGMNLCIRTSTAFEFSAFISIISHPTLDSVIS